MPSSRRPLAAWIIVSVALSAPHVSNAAPPEALTPEQAALPSPEGEEWTSPPPPPPPKDPVATPQVQEDFDPLEAKAKLSREGRGLRISGITFLSLGVVSGIVTLVGFLQARNARGQLEDASNLFTKPEERVQPIEDVDKWNAVTLASGIAAGVLAALGTTLLAIGVVKGKGGSKKRRGKGPPVDASLSPTLGGLSLRGRF